MTPATPPSPQDLLMPGGAPVGAEGTQPSIRELPGGETDAREFFDRLTVGGTVVPAPGYPGTLVALPGGGHVGFRPASKSGPPTVDVNLPGMPVRKVKFVGGGP